MILSPSNTHFAPFAYSCYVFLGQRAFVNHVPPEELLLPSCMPLVWYGMQEMAERAELKSHPHFWMSISNYEKKVNNESKSSCILDASNCR